MADLEGPPSEWRHNPGARIAQWDASPALDGWPDYSCQWRNPIPSSLGVEHHVKEYPATTSLIFVVVGKLAGLLGYEDARRSCS